MKQFTFDRKMVSFFAWLLTISTTIILTTSTILTAVAIVDNSTNMMVHELDVLATNTKENLAQYHTLSHSIVLDRTVQQFLEDGEHPEAHSGAVGDVLTTITNVWNPVNFISIIPYNHDYSVTRGWAIPHEIVNLDNHLLTAFEESLPTRNENVRISYDNELGRGGEYSLSLFFTIFSSTKIDQELGVLVINVNDTNMETLRLQQSEPTRLAFYTSFIHRNGQVIVDTRGSDYSYDEIVTIAPVANDGVIVNWNNIQIYSRLSGWNLYYRSQISWWTLIQEGIWVVLPLILIWALMVIIIARAAMRFVRNAKREQYQMDQIRMEALQSQIQPHFLYNTLDCIHWQAMLSGDPETSKLIRALADYYRICLSKGKDIISLQEELEHIKNYLLIQQTRYGEALNYSLTTIDEMEKIDIPKMTLQPLVEDAIYHGQKIRNAIHGHIHINIHSDKQRVFIEVIDDGIGIDDEQLRLLNESVKRPGEEIGYGVRNVNRRIQLYYGKQYGLSYRKQDDNGLVATVCIPLVKKMPKGVIEDDESIDS